MYKWEILLLWATVGLYVAATFLYIFSLVFKKDYFSRAKHITFLGLIPHTLSIILRWIESGHGPYITFYEVTISDTWMAIALFLIVQFKYRKMELLGVFIAPISFLLIGWGVMSSPQIYQVPTTFHTYWLFVHILFAKFSFGSFIIGTGLAIFYLVKGKKGDLDQSPLHKYLPDIKAIDEYSYRFIAFGFLNLGIMIAAGAIWANKAWGRYWGWDPVETWSLVSWLIYGVYLHLRLNQGWHGKKSAWYAIAGFAVLLFSIFGVVYLYHSAHSYYLKN